MRNPVLGCFHNNKDVNQCVHPRSVIRPVSLLFVPKVITGPLAYSTMCIVPVAEKMGLRDLKLSFEDTFSCGGLRYSNKTRF